MSAGKGSVQRPGNDLYSKNYDSIFKKGSTDESEEGNCLEGEQPRGLQNDNGVAHLRGLRDCLDYWL